MSAALPPDTICPTCGATNTQIPGAAGADGAPGVAGTPGQNAYTTTTANITMPAVGVTVIAAVLNSSWASILQTIYISGLGYFQVTAKPTATSITVRNLGYTGNAAPGLIVGMGQSVSPSGPIGATGASGVSSLNLISPTTTKGDLIVDNGVNSPNASLVAFPVGLDGTRPMADSTQPVGLIYSRVDLSDPTQVVNPPWPAATTDNAIARYDGVLGALQNSNIILTDAGNIQSTGGNVRGTAAVDLQGARTNAANVAAGNYSVLAGGRDNKTIGDYAVSIGGYQAFAEGVGSIAGGVTCRAVGDYSVATGKDSLAPVYGMRSHCAGKYFSFGDNAYGDYSAKAETTDATPTTMFLDNVSAVVGPFAASSMLVEVLILARQDNGDTAAWRFIGACKNDGGITADVAAFAGALLCASAGCAATWGQLANVTVASDAGTSSLKIEVTGFAGDNVRWMAVARFLALLNS